MKKLLIKTIATLIVFVMVFQLCPNIVLGIQRIQTNDVEAISGEIPEETTILDESENTSDKATIIGEDLEKRTLNEKHFILENGSEIAAVYPNNVHYEKDGELVDIDNTLVEAKNKAEEYTNKDNNFKVNLAKETKAGKLIRIEQNGHEVSWNLNEKQPKAISNLDLNSGLNVREVGTVNSRSVLKEDCLDKQSVVATKAKVLKESNVDDIDINKSKMTLDKINSAVKYSAILKGVDFKYDISSNSVKESIIIRNKQQIQTEFVFELNTNDLMAELQPDKSIILYNPKTNEEIFFIEAPYMFDGKLEFSDKINIELNETETGYELIIKPDKEWLLADERVYPVTIDPTVSSSLDRSNIKDTYIYDGDANNTTRGNAHILRIGNSKWLGPNGGNPVRALIKFDLPELSAGDQVINAALGIFNYPKTSEWTPPTREMQIDVHKMTGNWEESTAYWSNSAANFDTRAVDYSMYQYNSSTPNTCYEKVFNITSIAKDWYTTGNNYGVMLKEHNELRGYTAQSDGYFISSDTSTSYMNARPQVTIEYRNQTGLESYLSYHEQTAGRAGTIYTNDYNGNLVLVHPDLSTPGERMPVGINHVFNTNDKSTDIGYGKGYRLNLSQTISGEIMSATYSAHVEGVGWQNWVSEAQTAGTTGQNKRMEAIQIKLANNSNKARIKYQSYVQGVGWQDWVSDGATSGTTGQSLKVEAMRIVLDNVDKTKYSVMYRAHIESIGWQNWVSDGNIAGIVGQGLKIEAMEIKIVDKVGTLKYIDEDGTAHYFKKVSGTNYYEDEDGLGLKIMPSGTSYIMEDKDGNKSIFNKHADGNNLWHLKEIQDTNGDKITLTLSYNSARQFIITQVSDGAGDKLTLTYSGDKLVSIKNPSNKTIAYTYSNGNLTEITYPDAKKSKYSYLGDKLVTVQNIDNSKIQYEYYVEKTSRIKKISEYGIGGTIGNTLAISYGQNAAKFTDNKGYSNNYMFNDWGQVTSISDFGLEPENTDKALGKSYEYGSGINKNRLTLESNLMSVSEMPNNLIKNANFNDGMNNWTKDYTNGNDTVISVGNNKLYRVTGQIYAEKRCFQDITISGSAGDTFTLGTWVKSYGAPYNSDKNCSTRIDIHIYRQDGSIQIKSFVMDTFSTNWEYFAKQFTTDSAYKSIRVYLLYYNNVNDTYFDNVGLFKEEFGQSYTYDSKGNLVSTQDLSKENSTFKYNSNNQLTNAINPKGGEYKYTYDTNVKDRLISATNIIGQKYSFTYDSYGNTTAAKVQGIKESDVPKENQTFKIKIVSSGKYLDVDSAASNQAGAVLQQYQLTDVLNQKFKLTSTGDGYYSISTLYQPDKVIDYSGFTDNTIYQHNKHLQDNQRWRFVSNDDGTYRMVCKSKGDNYAATLEGDSSNNNARIKLEKWEGLQSQRLILENLSEPTSANNKYIEEKAEYTSNGNYTSKSINQEGNATQYAYNQTTGTLSKETNAKQAETNYTYDNVDRLTKVEQATSNKLYKNEYTYENDRLKTISHNGFSYQFIYDEFGNTTQVKVGNTTLVTNTYEANNGKLTNVKYGNNQTIGYQYDRFNRATKVNTTAGSFSYNYDAKSNLKQTIDGVNGTTQNYTYDLSDRLVKQEIANGIKTEYKYDQNSNINEVKNTLNSTSKTTKYSYDRDNRINNIVLSDGVNIITGYDTLSRTKSKELILGSKNYKTEYKYKDTSTTNKTTTIVESIKNGNNDEIKYTYDVLGNIETISLGSELQQKYYYDELNQLTREDNVVLNKTIVYNHDEGGNILSKVEYPYTTGTLGIATNTINYSYDNTNWKDQLTSYNNKALTYDAIGNPLTYDGNTYTWQNGRQLARIQNTNMNLDVTYKYNDSGIRTEKTVNGVTTKYYLEGTKVIYEQTGSNTLYYSYDENGQVIGMEYNNSKYYYVKNAQGDIIGLLDSNLNQVASYIYDSWGKCISVKDNAGNIITDMNHIANKNPYRYRSYRYDSETGMYYLQSRYYNPEWGRFLNADAVINTYGSIENTNMYAYCNNNPVNMSDPEGEFPWLLILGAIAIITTIIDIVTAIQEPTAINVGAAVLGIVPGGKAVSTGAKVTKTVAKTVTKVTTKTAVKKTAQQLGKEGEVAVSKLINQPKNVEIIRMGEKNRIPDFYKPGYMAEVKNTASQSFTKQLRDYQSHATQEGLTFDLFIRQGANISKPLRNSGINIRYIP